MKTQKKIESYEKKLSKVVDKYLTELDEWEDGAGFPILALLMSKKMKEMEKEPVPAEILGLEVMLIKTIDEKRG